MWRLGLDCSLYVTARCVHSLARSDWVRKFEWSVCVDSGRCLQVDIHEPEVVAHAVGAHDLKLWVIFRFLSHVTDAKTADVIVTTGWYQHCVEVAKTDGTVELENLFLFGIVGWVVVSYLHILLIDICLDPHLVPLSYLSIFDSFVDSAPLLPFHLFLILHILYAYVVNVTIAQATIISTGSEVGAAATISLPLVVATHQ